MRQWRGDDQARKHPVLQGVLRLVLTASVGLGAAYGGMKMAIEENADDVAEAFKRIEQHEALSTHADAATRQQVHALERGVERIGAQIEAQLQQLSEIKEELRFLRRRRGR